MMTLDKKIGEKIKMLREGRNMSRLDLAKKLNYESDTAIYLIEKGERSLTAEKLRILADVFKITVSELISEDVPKETQGIVSALRADESLTEKDLDKITSFIDFIKSEGKKNASGR